MIMRDLKKYKAPSAEITVFECAEDIMTASLTPKALDKTNGVSGRNYIQAGTSKRWDEIYK